MQFCKPASGPSVSPPPASAPPVAPPDDSEPFPLGSVNLEEFSYQRAYGSDGKSILVPKVSVDYGLANTFFEDIDGTISSNSRPPLTVSSSGRVLHNGFNLPSMRGDASIQPNTGNSNQSAGDALGSLQEITTVLRWTTIASTCAAIVWEGFFFPLRLIGSFLTNPAQVVLGAYLGLLCLLVLCAEFNHKALRDNFGFLYFPLSRGIVLLMMSGMCLGILNQWWESLLGLAFGGVGWGYIYTYIKYPEYRRWQHYNERMPTAWQEAKMYWAGESSIRTAAWADPRNNNAYMTPRNNPEFASETQFLLNTI